MIAIMASLANESIVNHSLPILAVRAEEVGPCQS